jgi:hypothetical protein
MRRLKTCARVWKIPLQDGVPLRERNKKKMNKITPSGEIFERTYEKLQNQRLRETPVWATLPGPTDHVASCKTEASPKSESGPKTAQAPNWWHQNSPPLSQSESGLTTTLRIEQWFSEEPQPLSIPIVTYKLRLMTVKKIDQEYHSPLTGLREWVSEYFGSKIERISSWLDSSKRFHHSLPNLHTAHLIKLEISTASTRSISKDTLFSCCMPIANFASCCIASFPQNASFHVNSPACTSGSVEWITAMSTWITVKL